MDQKKIKTKLREQTNSIYVVAFVVIMFGLVSSLGIELFINNSSIFKIDNNNQFVKVKALYALCLIIAVIMYILLHWPRFFDKRELALYNQYITDKEKLKKEIKKEKFEQKIKKLEEEKSKI